ncbi:NACHT domain-containing protein [Actinoplanes sp. NPDC048988]|uniref:NACHT domain-containing protein n=1 Tax=Actinoplanes sp. NPDC048988 TaxID=3363901 RepID=UPI00371215C0
MLDPISAGIISSYLANVFSDSVLEVYREWRDRTQEPAPSLSAEALDESLNRALLSRFLDSEAPATDRDALIRFFTSRDLGNLTTDAVAFHIVREGQAILSTLNEECRQLLISYGVTRASSTVASTKIVRLIDEVAIECVEAIKPDPAGKQKDQNNEAQHQREAALRRIRERQTTRIAEQLATLNTLNDEEHVDLQTIERKVSQIREAVDQVHGHLTPPGVLEVTRVPIDDLYVVPRITLDRPTQEPTKPYGLDRRESDLPASTDIAELLESAARLVVVGNPGAGKTTLSHYIAQRVSNDLLPGATERRSKDNPVLSFPIVLRELREPIFSPTGVDIIGAAKMVLANRYQVSLSRAEVGFLCSSGRVLLILDGLDEITHRQDREAVSRSVDAFARLHPRCRILVTSRVVGYRQAPLSSELFQVATIGPFSAEQVGSYARKWFDLHLHKDLTSSERRTLTASFLAESSNIEDLRENPLLLALICNLYRHQRFIPRNRPEIYVSCSRLLFDTWDRRRRLRPVFEFDAHVDGMVQHIAAWVFSRAGAQGGVQEETLISVATEYLSGWQYRNQREARTAAGLFLEFCRDRAWILTEIGQSPRGDRLYGFTHRTFLEYFAAEHYKETLTADQLIELMVDKSKTSYWNIVCQLIVQLSSKKERGLENRLIDAIVDHLDELEPQERDIAFTVCAGSLESIPLRPETVERVARASIKYYRESLLAAPNAVGHSSGPPKGREVYWLESSRVSAENLRAASEAVAGELENLLEGNRKRSKTLPSRYPVVVKTLAHLFDFEFGQSVRQTGFRARFSDQFSRAAAEILRISTEPWVESVALSSGLMIDTDPGESLLVRTLRSQAGPRRIEPMMLPWGCRSAPSLAEIVVWWGINATADDQPFIDEVLLPRALAARAALREPPAEFTPHSTWLAGALGGTGPITTDTVGLSPMFRDCATHLALMLVRSYVSADPETAHNRVAEMGVKQWGNLRLVSTAIECRYDLGGPGLSDADRDALCDLGFRGWLDGSTEPAPHRTTR